MLFDTIAAISTPLGEGGIGIVRISGSRAFDIAGRIFRSHKNKDWQGGGSHRLYYGHALDPEGGNVIDEVLLGVMKAPHTFTREDMVEFNCHGGIVPLKRLLETIINNGARLAGPGEFSKRAFLNGRLDLAQAESIIDVIRAKTDAALNLAVSQLRGELSGRIKEIQDDLLGVLAHIEATIDYPEEDIREATRKEIKEKSLFIQGEIEKLLAGAEAGKIYREGIYTAIIGRPNVGKSSLLNAFLREKRAIVTEVPGTTRDVIEEIINLRGIPLKLADTAGLRETSDVVEKIGVELSRELLNRADLLLIMIDARAGLTAEDRTIIDMARGKSGVVIVNKIDVGDGESAAGELREMSPGKDVVLISVREGRGIEELEDKIEEMILGGKVTARDDILVSNIRHKQSLAQAGYHVGEVLKALDGPVPEDLISIDLRSAWEALGEVTGSSVTEDLLDRIFADFCIGK